jgi:hypothetical protein
MTDYEKKLDELENSIRKLKFEKPQFDCSNCICVDTENCDYCDGVCEFIHKDNKEYIKIQDLYIGECNKLNTLENENYNYDKEIKRLKFLLEAEEQKCEESNEYVQDLLKKLSELKGLIREIYEYVG